MIASVQLAWLCCRNDASQNCNNNSLYAKDHWLTAHQAVVKRVLAENLTPISRKRESVNLDKAKGSKVLFSFHTASCFEDHFSRETVCLTKRQTKQPHKLSLCKIFLKKPIKTWTKKHLYGWISKCSPILPFL